MAGMACPMNDDMLSELLIAKLLEDDMHALQSARIAEDLQFHEALSVSALIDGHPTTEDVEGQCALDDDMVLDVLAAEIHANRDALFAQALMHAEESSIAASRQYAQQLAAAEKKCALDNEFAKRLQQAIDDGEDNENRMLDAESVLEQDEIDTIMASDLNDKGKGKRLSYNIEGPVNPEVLPSSFEPLPICGICMEPFQATHSPVVAAQSANSSARAQFGMHLPCPTSHGYCISCLAGYINSKLDPDGTGGGDPITTVFPVRCPECAITAWPEGIPDTVAERVLSEKGIVLWHHQKMLDSMPRYYCPNARCSALVQIVEEADHPQMSCPSCDSLICVPCRVVWHSDMSCEGYQALPLDERSPEDQKALQLMKAQHWRRCPNCAIIVDLMVGCNHITCRCKTEFCYKCGALWDIENRRCSRVPSCELWDEELLLEANERRRELEQDRPEAGALRLPPARDVYELPPRVRYEPPPPYQPVAHQRARGKKYTKALLWMDDPDVLCVRHWFTSNMITSLSCQYCNARLQSLAGLRYHLSNVRRHPVYACCGRFFQSEEDLDRHLNSRFTRLGQHEYTVRRH